MEDKESDTSESSVSKMLSNFRGKVKINPKMTPATKITEGTKQTKHSIQDDEMCKQIMILLRLPSRQR